MKDYYYYDSYNYFAKNISEAAHIMTLFYSIV